MKRKFIRGIIFIMTLTFCAQFAGCADEPNPMGKKAMITTDEALAMINENKDNVDFIILDVRTPEEYAEMHIEGSINRPLMEKYDFLDSISDISKDKTIVVHCRTQNRSKRAYDYMVSDGYKDIYYMLGGITEWESENKPLIR